MIELFANPGYVAAGGALISSPIIIHLINRMRFKRLRWAAMEFLLKAQKKSRRRLIIEQLLLLMLRCLLVLLTAMLVSRFLGFSFGTTAEQETIHVVLLDDTLSMTDRWEDKEGAQNAYKAAKKFIEKKILDNLKQSNNIERLVLIPLSKLATDKDKTEKKADDKKRAAGTPQYPKFYGRLSDPTVAETITKDLAELQPTKLHVDLLLGLNQAHDYIKKNTGSKIVVHVLSDFRKSDWTGPESQALHKSLLSMVKDQDRVRVRLVDVVAPNRVEGQGGVMTARDNLAIVDFQAATRVAPKGKRVEFRVKVANYSASEASVGLIIYNDQDGKEVLDADFKDRMPLVVPAMGTATARFEKAFYPDVNEEDKTLYIRLAAHLVNPDRSALKNDGIAEDNVRHASVEIRSQVPLLLVDGENEKGLGVSEKVIGKRTVKIMGDSLAVSKSIEAFEGRRDAKAEKEPRYKVVLAHELAAGDGRKVLASPDLEKYQTIMLMNVGSLDDEQLARLEKYVREGGGLAIFLGPKVKEIDNLRFYNEKLYNNGKGLFPVPLERNTIPPLENKDQELERNSKQFQLLLREDQFPNNESVPIFGEFIKQDRNQINWLKHLPVKRYWPAQPRQAWKGEPGKVKEIFTRPNNDPIKRYAQVVRNLALELPQDDARYKSYRPGLKRHFDRLIKMTDEKDVGEDKTLTANQPAYLLADALDELLNDRGLIKDLINYPNLTEFWNLPDPQVTSLRSKVQTLRQELRYSHPMMITNQYGRGRVVAVMTTAGQEWNDWSGGITGDAIYAPILFEMQNYLSSQGGGSSKLVGPGDSVLVDASQIKRKLRVVRKFFQPQMGNIETKLDPEFARLIELKKDETKGEEKDKEKQKKQESDTKEFGFANTPEPGFALLEISEVFNDKDLKENGVLIETRSCVYNVDSLKEGNLQRATQADMESNLLREANSGRSADNLPIRFLSPEDTGEALVARPMDLSQSPWFFLFFIAILVAEQALAVHLSFHLKNTEAELPTQVVKPQTRAA